LNNDKQLSKVSRRKFIKTSASLGLTTVFSYNLLTCSKNVSEKPNIILIMTDDLGYECIGANGGTSYKTPVLDRLAEKGVRFEHCYSQPLCTPSRVQIMTGMYNIQNYIKFGTLDRKQITFARLLKKNGYKTCVTGKWQLGKKTDSPKHFGFHESCLWQHTLGRKGTDGLDTRYQNPVLTINGKDVYHNPGEYGPDIVSDYACNFMERNRKKPFLIYYPMILTHCPFVPTPDSEDWDPKSKGSETYKGDQKYFGDMVSYMDKIIGKLIAKLEELGLRNNTLVLFTGDNGTDKPVVSMMNDREVAGAKGQTTDAGIRVPLIANWPGVIPPGQVRQDLVDFSDFLPCLCECANVSIPKKLKTDGRSFLPQLQGNKGNPREWIYCWYSRNGDSEKAKEFARNKKYKLYRTREFYNISNDVLEKTNLITSDLNEEAQKAHTLLQKVLNQYRDARPPHLGL
jgi:arylsulfatase A